MTGITSGRDRREVVLLVSDRAVPKNRFSATVASSGVAGARVPEQWTARLHQVLLRRWNTHRTGARRVPRVGRRRFPVFGSGWTSNFLITYEPHLATGGRRKPGIRRPRNDVSGGPNVDSRPAASHRGRWCFVSVARMSLVRNQVELCGTRLGTTRSVTSSPVTMS